MFAPSAKLLFDKLVGVFGADEDGDDDWEEDCPKFMLFSGDKLNRLKLDGRIGGVPGLFAAEQSLRDALPCIVND